MIHEQSKHKSIRFEQIPDMLIDLSHKLKSIDFTVLEHLDKKNDDSVALGWGIRGAICPEFKYIYGSFDDDLFYRLKFKNDQLIYIKISNRHNHGGDMTAFQALIGDKKILINDTWFDRMEFEAETFQMDTQSIYPFSLVGISDVLKSFGVQYVYDGISTDSV